MSEKPSILPCEKPCPKCGAASVRRKFIQRMESVYNEVYDGCKNVYALGQCNSFYAARDHIDNFCNICEYRWQTIPLPKSRKAAAKKDKP